jgi:hypothetical protein
MNELSSHFSLVYYFSNTHQQPQFLWEQDIKHPYLVESTKEQQQQLILLITLQYIVIIQTNEENIHLFNDDEHVMAFVQVVCIHQKISLDALLRGSLCIISGLYSVSQ